MIQIVLLVAIGGVLLASRVSRQQWFSTFWGLPRSARWGLGFVLVLGVLSSAFAPAPFYAFLELGHFVLLFVSAGVVASVVRRAPKQTKQLLLGAVSIGTLLYAVYFLVGYGVSVALPSLEIGRETISGFANVRFFNQYQTWTLPLLAVPVITLPRGWWVPRMLLFVVLVLWWTLLFGSVVRGALLAIIVAFVGVSLLFRRRALQFIAVQTVTFGVGLILYYLLFPSGGEGAPEVLGKLDDTRSYYGRIEHWRICLEMVTAHPILGAGPMHYAWPPINFMPPAHPHNAFMQWLGEWGLPSTVIMSGLTMWGGWRWIQQEKATTAGTEDDSDTLRVALVASVLAGAAYAMVSGVVVMPVSQVLLVLVSGWAWGRYRYEQYRDPSRSFSWSVHAVLCLLLLGSMGVVGSSFHDLSIAEERRSTFAESVDRRALSPRYWQQGYLEVRDSTVIDRARREF